MNDTRAKLLEAAADTVREHGTAGASARVIAARAGVNQALVFYHFDTVSNLIEAACRVAVDEAAGRCREQLAGVTSLTGLLDVGRELHRQERDLGNVALLAQLMSGVGRDPVLADAARYAMSVWVAEIEQVVERALHDSPLAAVIDPAGLARAVSAAFIGMELYEGVDPDGAADALDAVQQLGVLVGVLVGVIDDLGPVVRLALRSRLRGVRRPAPVPGA